MPGRSHQSGLCSNNGGINHRIPDRNRTRSSASYLLFWGIKPLVFLITLLATWRIEAQNILIGPYLQDATPHSMYILWETDSGDESIVEWGTDANLSSNTSGTFWITPDQSRMHEVLLDNLDHHNTYFYRVKTLGTYSDIYSFRTHGHSAHEDDTHIVAMSDVQQDANNPDKFREVVEEGIIEYFEQTYGGDITDHLALVMIPGDLVNTGSSYAQWQTQFFEPSKELLARIPMYPVLGNHEVNADYYFQFFRLPENGTPGFEEHWWYKDYSNIRIIGLDSNAPFTNQEQLSWLDTLLTQTCTADSVDFVFAQLHHPHKSELWTPGESDYTGEVIQRLEAFSTKCGKPSIHFFGHTHGYSRGQSRDHKHLWINVATGGGAIDYWGEYPNFDYDEFSVTQDEFGFVSVAVTAGADPQITIKRISRGNKFAARDNDIRDSLVIRKNVKSVAPPYPVFPVNEMVSPDCVMLKATGFSSMENSVHGQSHWQVTAQENDFASPVKDQWKNYENWYDQTDTQAGDDLTDEAITNLAENTTYWWRVRYRDREFNWSDWSAMATFTTGSSQMAENQLINPGAEDSLALWTITDGVVEALTANVCNGITPHTGERYFVVGGLCTESAFARCHQDMDLTAYLDSIQGGLFPVQFGGWLSNFNGSVLPEMRLIFLDASGQPIDSSQTLSTNNSSWTRLENSLFIPPGTQTLRLELTGTRLAGTDNDSYFDDLFVRLGSSMTDCDEYTSNIQPAGPRPSGIRITPNPWKELTQLSFSSPDPDEIHLVVTDASGRQAWFPYTVTHDGILMYRGDQPAGQYLIQIRQDNQIHFSERFIVID